MGAALAVWCDGLYRSGWAAWNGHRCSGSSVGVAAPLGDLFESKIKRDAGTKDAGTLFGAHGGALDRLDAAFFTLVAGYYVWLALRMTGQPTSTADDRDRGARAIAR